MASAGVDLPAAVLVHGQPGSGEYWDPLAELLGGKYIVIAPDRPGWGSNPEDARGIADNANWLAKVIEEAGVNRPSTIVGHSLGGGIAIELALTRPDLVGALVLIGSVGVDVALSPFDRVLAVPVLAHSVMRFGAAGVRGSRKAVARLSTVSLIGRIRAGFNTYPTVRALAWIDTQPLTGRERQSFITEQKWLLAETSALQARLGLLSVPTAVVHGSVDRIVSREATHLLAELIPGAEWIRLEGEGHLVTIERPELLAPLIDRYARMADAGGGHT